MLEYDAGKKGTLAIRIAIILRAEKASESPADSY
jgi:hypothetical protein